MFGIGMSEMILICALALIVVGPDKLPELARSIAKGVIELKKTATGLKDNLTDELGPSLDILKPELEEASKALKENISHQNRLSSPPDSEIPKVSDASETTGESSSTEEQDALLKVADELEVTEPKTNHAMSTDELIARARKVKDNFKTEEDSDA